MSEPPMFDRSDRVRVIGTAHISSSSVAAVKAQIEAFQPDIVAVELCASRHSALTSNRRLDKEGLLKVVKEGKAPLVMLQSLLAAEQRKMGLDEGSICKCVVHLFCSVTGSATIVGVRAPEFSNLSNDGFTDSWGT